MKKLLFRFTSLSLRTHLLIMALLLAVPAIAIIVDSGLKERQEAIQAEVYQSRRVADSIVSEQYNLTGDAEELGMVLAQLQDVKSRRIASVTSILSDIHKKSAHYGNIVITDPTGTVWASALPMGESFSLKDKLSFIDARDKRRFSAGQYVVGKISARPTIGFGYPLFDGHGVVDGVILLNINFSRFNDLIRRNGLSRGSSFAMVDRNGIIVNHSEAAQFIGHKDPLFESMRGGVGEGTFFNRDSRGDAEIVSYRALRLHDDEPPYLYVRVNIPLKDTLARARGQQLSYMAIFSVFLLGAFALVVLIAKYCFLDRILKLQEVSGGLADGELDTNVSQAVQGGEMGELALAFDEMAGKVRQREEDLRSIAAERREVIAQLQEAMSQIDTLNSMLPICSFCNKIRDDYGQWSSLESYVTSHAEAPFTQCICPECSRKVVTEVEER